MNFQNLQKIETADRYLDFAFSAAKKRAEELRDSRARSKINKSKNIESERITIAIKVLRGHLVAILNAFPIFEELPAFYKELVRITIRYPDLKKSLGAVGWAISKCDFFFRDYNHKILRTRDITKINEYRREFYGRISSVMKQVKDDLVFLEQARQIMREYPHIKTSLKTICIFGFPNVGKSTLLAKITDATPEIKNYAFTTTSLNLGTLKHGIYKYQFIDTPGTLDRFYKMNLIEQQAYLALKHCSDGVVYVFDLTEGYEFEKQYQLFENLLRTRPDVPIFVYLSKSDIVGKSAVEMFTSEFRNKYPQINEPFTDKDLLVAKIVKAIKPAVVKGVFFSRD
jgi:nucleolar GTP-binding protein